MDSSTDNTRITRATACHRSRAAAETPALCARGCGFYGTAVNGGLCSKCYVADLNDKNAKLLLDKHYEREEDDEEESAFMKGVYIPPTSPFPLAQRLRLIRERKRKNRYSQFIETKQRCCICTKKIGLIGFKCKCGQIFCAAHRLPEDHRCKFDFKIAGRLRLIEQNPVCKGDKLKDRV